jgi:phosphate transport system substrate-binding protein
LPKEGYPLTEKKPIIWLSLLVALGLLVAACGSDKKDSSSTSSTSTTAAGGSSSVDYSSLSGTIKGSGSSFTNQFIQASIAALADKASGLTVNYNPTGSGQGKKDLGGSLVDFAGTDSLVKAGDGPADGSFLYVPTVAAPITISYNLSGVKDLKLSADTVAGLFDGTIKKWNDQAIAKDNPSAQLPSTSVVIVHRADASGTTSNFTKYLTKAAPTAWKLGSSDTVAWPADSQAGQKNTGVAQIVKSTDGAIGYVDLADATSAGLVVAQIQNADGKFVKPTIAGAAAAVAAATVNADLSYDPINPAGADVYPITSPTFLLVRTKYPNQQTLNNVKGFVTFLLNDGQGLAATNNYAKLSDSLRQQALAQLDKITVG